MLTRIFKPKRNDIRREWGRLRKNEFGMGCSTYGRGLFRVLVGKTGGRRPLGRPKRRWENNIKIDSQKVGRIHGWIDLARDGAKWRAVLNSVMSVRVTQNAGNFFST
jgi:hypothetical protein